jgi:hypothetical protein
MRKGSSVLGVGPIFKTVIFGSYFINRFFYLDMVVVGVGAGHFTDVEADVQSCRCVVYHLPSLILLSLYQYSK